MEDDFDFEDDFDQHGCWNCDGDGYVWDCIDGFCLTAEEGCDLCTRRCSVCNPAKRPASEGGESHG